MNGEMVFVFGLVIVTAILMATNRVRYDVIALLVVLALMLSGVLTVGQSIAGFGSSVVILVAALLIIGEMLDRTGVARAVGEFILKRGGSSEVRLIVLLMSGAAVLGTVMSSTAVVAVFIPIVARIASETGVKRQRLLMPMAYAALISGMLTLIATTPNIVVSEELESSGARGFGFFSFSLIGVAVLIAGIGYMLTLGRRLLPNHSTPEESESRGRTLRDLFHDFQVSESIDCVRLSATASLAGRTIAESGLGERGVRIVGIRRGGTRTEEQIVAPDGATLLRVGDTLLVTGEMFEHLDAFPGVTVEPISPRALQRWLWEAGSVSVLVHPESGLIGRSIKDVRFRSRYGLHVLGVRNGQQAVEDHANRSLRAGDMLLLSGRWSRIDALRAHTHDFVVMETPRERTDVVKAYRKRPVALAILAMMVILTVFELVPLTAAVLLAALAAILTRCLSMDHAYRAMHWSSIVLIAGLLPLADALAVTGGTDFLVNVMMTSVGELGPYAVFTALFFLTAGLSLFLSNTAAAVLVAPIAIYAAEQIGVSPYPMAIAVVMGASAAYATPVASPIVTLVVEPGRYRFTDFVRVGVPLLILTWLVVVLVTPLLFPFGELVADPTRVGAVAPPIE
ncbi:MAG: SLC13 family permease [Planctomycetota bacterium]